MKQSSGQVDNYQKSNKLETDIKPKKENQIKLENMSGNGKIMASPINSNNPGSINVVCRFRPLNEKEKLISQEYCCEFLDYNQVMVKSSSENNTYKFNFDRVFDPNSHQQEVYDFAAKHIVESVLEGFNGTIFAYGQTSSGKTHTMQGIIDNPEKEGIIPRMIRHMFNFIVNSSSDTEYIVKVSMIEIYMEKIKDLIDSERTNLNVREDKAKGIYIEDLSEHYVACEDEVLEIMKLGSDNRSVAATNMNEHSSRSHSIFIMTIHQNNIKDMSAKTGKLYLVDLAGSEKISKTGATGLTLEEAKTINKSLTTLGMVINSLTDGKSTHIPYRESKLTRVLQESLGGNAKTCLIITCSPSIYNESETLSTLRFGLRAKKIKNKPKINKETTVAELKIEIDKMDKVIQKLNKRIIQLENYIVKNGLPIPPEDADFENDFEIQQNIQENEEENNNFNEKLAKEIEVKVIGEKLEGNISSDDMKISFGNIKFSRITGGFPNLMKNNDCENHNKLINDQLKTINELEEQNKTLNEQIEFLHEFISRLDKELELKSNAIESLEKLNKRQEDDFNNFKNSIEENMKKGHIITENITFQENESKIKVNEKEENNPNSDENNKNLKIDEEKFDNNSNKNIDEFSENIKINNRLTFHQNEIQSQNLYKNYKNYYENKEEINNNDLKTSFENEEEKIIEIRKDNLINSSNKIFFGSEEKYLDIEKDGNSERNSVAFFKSDSKTINNLINEESNNEGGKLNFDIQEIKLLERTESKRDFNLMELFQKFKKEKNINRSMNFSNFKNIFSNQMSPEEQKKDFSCQTEENYELKPHEENKNDRFLSENCEDGETSSNLKTFNYDFGKENSNKNLIKDILNKMENLNNKIKEESHLIENLKNIEQDMNVNDKAEEVKFNQSENLQINIETNKIITDNSNKLESQLGFVMNQLDCLITEVKKNANSLNTYENSNMPIDENKIFKYSKEDLELITSDIKLEHEDKFNNEKRKSENEKKTILKVLEEKCEKFNMMEIENGDLKNKIKLLEYKMSPEEKNYKKFFVRLEQNIDQLNLSLEKTVTEKTQLAINLKVLEKKFFKRNLEIEKLNKEYLELKDQIRKKEENNQMNQRGTLRTMTNTNPNLVKIIRGGIYKQQSIMNGDNLNLQNNINYQNFPQNL